MILVVVLIAMSVSASSAVVLYFVLRDKGDAYEGLPTSPPQFTIPLSKKHSAYKPLVAKGQEMINALFEVRSDCWNVNYVYRKLVPEWMVTANAEVLRSAPLPNGPWERVRDSKEMKAMNLAMGFKLMSLLELVKQELRKCPRSAVISHNGKEWSVGDILDSKQPYIV